MHPGMPRRHALGLSLAAAVALGAVGDLPGAILRAQAPGHPDRVTTFKEAFGFNIGDDYQVATYTQLEAHWKKLAAESRRMKLVDIGPSEEGRHQYMAIISSPE